MEPLSELHLNKGTELDEHLILKANLKPDYIKLICNKELLHKPVIELFKTPGLDYEIYHKIYYNLKDATKEERAAYAARVEIDDVTESLYSEKVARSHDVSYSRNITESDIIINCTDIENSKNIINSSKVETSTRVHSSTEVENSDNVVFSNEIRYSSNVYYSENLDDCHYVNDCKDCVALYYGYACDKLLSSDFCAHVHCERAADFYCLFCFGSDFYNGVDKYYIFNKPVSSTEFYRVKEILLFWLEDFKVELPFSRIYSVKNFAGKSYIYSFFPADFWKKVQSLPNYSETLLSLITGILKFDFEEEN